MDELREYLYQIFEHDFALDVYDKRLSWEYYLQDYDPQLLRIQNQSYLLMVVKDITMPLENLLMHANKMAELSHLRPILYFRFVSMNVRRFLIINHLAFLALNKQLYIPNERIDLNETFISKTVENSSFTPSEQLTFLFLFNRPGVFFSGAKLAQRFSLSPMTLSRSLAKLDSLGLLQNKGIRTGITYALMNKKEAYQKAKKWLINPISQRLLAPNTLPLMAGDGVTAGLSALTEYTSLAHDRYDRTIAISKSIYQLYAKAFSPYDSMRNRDWIVVEVWKYDPSLVAANQVVDELSLLLSFDKPQDERIQAAMRELTNLVCKE